MRYFERCRQKTKKAKKNIPTTTPTAIRMNEPESDTGAVERQTSHPNMCVRVRECVCETERERERDGETERERGRERERQR